MAKIIIAAKDLKRVSNYNKSSVMKGLLSGGGGEIMRKKIVQKDFYSAMRKESQSQGVGYKSFTKKKLTDFFGKMLENKKDRLTDIKVKKLADLYGIKRGKLYSAAAEARSQQNNTRVQSLIAERQAHQKKENEINSHISDIALKGIDKARASLHASGAVTKNGDITHSGGEVQENVLVKLGVSDNNIRKYENSSFSPSVKHFSENHSTAFGHLSGLKQSQYNHFGARDIGIEEAKSRLTSLQEDKSESDKDEV